MNEQLIPWLIMVIGSNLSVLLGIIGQWLISYPSKKRDRRNTQILFDIMEEAGFAKCNRNKRGKVVGIVKNLSGHIAIHTQVSGKVTVIDKQGKEK